MTTAGLRMVVAAEEGVVMVAEAAAGVLAQRVARVLMIVL
jgi:hypothetical protein